MKRYKKASERKSKIIRVRLTQGELKELESEARKTGKSLSEVIRERLKRDENDKALQAQKNLLD